MRKPNKDTIDSIDLAYFFSNLESKPVYAYCAYNYYRLYKVTDLGHCYVLLSPEEEGCWQHSSSIIEKSKEIKEDNNGPSIA